MYRVLGVFGILCVYAALLASLASAQPTPQAVRFDASGSVELRVDGSLATLHPGQHLGPWTLMKTIKVNVGKPTRGHPARLAVLEDFTEMDGSLIFVDSTGIRLRLPKCSEPTSATDSAPPYLGHSIDEVMKSPADLLGDQILSRPGDPDYEQVASALPPIRKMLTYAFVGSPLSFDKIGFEYGGRTPDFDPAIYFASVAAAREKGTVRNGLVGGYLPILRFVYPEVEGSWVEMLAYAPLRIAQDNNRIQPVWYRVARVENNSLKWVRYIDSYQPFPPRTQYDAQGFYTDLVDLHLQWNRKIEPGMKIDVPDERIANMARFSLIQEMMTRIRDYPKYGVLDRNYGGSEHDGFPDTFTVDTAAMLEWGMIDQAGRYIDNYFEKFVRDDGSILYRGPETGQYGRALTIVAQYANYGGDPSLLLRLRSRLDAVASLLLALRERAKRQPRSSPSYGMIAGWSEADACLDPDPERYIQPYFSNSTEAARGFHDLGIVWENIGRQKGRPELVQWGRQLQRESLELERDIQTAISRSILKADGEKILPSIAGVPEPFHVAVPRDKADPQFRSYRAYMEMLYSGILTDDQVKMIVDYRSRQHDVILGMPTAYGYNTGEIAGFLSYGHGYALIQHDMIRKALLLTYSDMAHQYTRGIWTAPETRSILPGQSAAPYCAPAQMVVALMAKWLLVFEEPEADVVWLAKGAPRDWMRDGKSISVEDAPTRWGRFSYSIHSHLATGTVAAEVRLPTAFTATAKLRLRVPGESPLKSVTVNGQSWSNFDASSGTITLPSTHRKELHVIASF